MTDGLLCLGLLHRELQIAHFQENTSTRFFIDKKSHLHQLGVMSSVDNYSMNPLCISQLGASKKNLICSQGDSAMTDDVDIKNNIF